MNFNPISIKKTCYTMAVENNTAEITMYGDIVETQPVDYWTGEELPGDYITQDEFISDLDSIIASGCKKIIIRMNSYGGDAGVAIFIHNKLRELSKNGVTAECIVEGVAMSGGSLIMCACDKVTVSPSCLIMIHKAWTFLFGGYNSDDLRSIAKQNDAWDKAQVEIYKRKCGLTDTVILHMMSETTVMTGKEALEKGFADELLEDAEPLPVAASADRKSIFVGGLERKLGYGFKAPESIPLVATSEKDEVIKIKMAEQTAEGGQTMAKNLDELRVENPELASAVEKEIKDSVSADNASAVNAAAENERKRLSEIDAIAHLYDDETVREAKYGENPCTAPEMAYRAALEASKNGSAFMANAKKDFEASGADKVGASCAPEAEKKSDSPGEISAQAKKDVERFAKMRGGK